MSDTKIPLRRPASSAESQKVQEQPRYPTETVDLPTKGWFYPEGHILSSGQIELKQMTAREEDILANTELARKGTLLDKLLQSLIVNKDIDYRDILIPDKNAIFIAVRRLAYGDTYSVKFTCPSCTHESKIDINLGSLKDREVDVTQFPRGKNSFTFELPKAKTIITYKILSQGDDQAIDKELEGLRKIHKDGAGEVTTRLKHVITSVNGDESPELIRQTVDEMLAVDARSLREHIAKNTPDIDMHFDFKCERCDLERRSLIPVGTSFLWPDLET